MHDKSKFQSKGRDMETDISAATSHQLHPFNQKRCGKIWAQFARRNVNSGNFMHSREQPRGKTSSELGTKTHANTMKNIEWVCFCGEQKVKMSLVYLTWVTRWSLISLSALLLYEFVYTCQYRKLSVQQQQQHIQW